MAKLTRGYYTFFEHTKYKWTRNQPKKFALSFNPSEYSYLYSFNDDRSSYGNVDKVRGGLQPLADMWKDLKDTFKPYKGSYQAKRDLLQPFRGIGNVGGGIISFIGGILYFLYKTVEYAFDNSRGDFSEKMKLNAARTTGWMVDGISSVVRGCLQIGTTPFTWFLRMPLRAIITAVKGSPKIEDNTGIQQFIRKAQSELASQTANEYQAKDSLRLIARALTLKFEIARTKGQTTTIKVADENAFYLGIQQSDFSRDLSLAEVKSATKKYVSLFDTKHLLDQPEADKQTALLQP